MGFGRFDKGAIMATNNRELKLWVEQSAALTKPEKIHWCDGSTTEYNALTQAMVDSGDLIKLNETTYPNCFLHRSHPNDVARTENLTFICSPRQEDAGPNNNWMSPREGHKKIDALFDGCMKGRTMYVVPYCMGPIDSPFSRCGVELTDSAYVAANMKIMTRMGSAALKRIEKEGTFVKGLHSIGDLNPERRLIMHFPDELTIKSVGSGYGGNALLGKKCHALRIASAQASTEGWLAEHMLIMGLESPEGEIQLLESDQTRPNGIAFSPDQQTLYVANSDGAEKEWYAYDVMNDGTISNPRIFYDVNDQDTDGAADGMKVDVSGNIFATGPGGVWIFSPEGDHLGTIRPEEVPANVAWGDDGSTLYMTARTGLYRIRLNTRGNIL